jgi:excisionase family DNA binding protein
LRSLAGRSARSRSRTSCAFWWASFAVLPVTVVRVPTRSTDYLIPTCHRPSFRWAGLDPSLHPIPNAAAVLGIGRSTLYQLISRGEIEVVKIGRRTLVAQTELERYVRKLGEVPA